MDDIDWREIDNIEREESTIIEGECPYCSGSNCDYCV